MNWALPGPPQGPTVRMRCPHGRREARLQVQPVLAGVGEGGLHRILQAAPTAPSWPESASKLQDYPNATRPRAITPFLSQFYRFCLGAAREKLRVGAALADLNHLSAAMACGRLSYSVVRAITRVATPDNEARLVAVACCATGAQVERLVRGWRQADQEEQPDAEQMRLARRTLSTRVDEDGMVLLRGRLTPEVGAVLLRALEAALEQVPQAAEGDEANIAQRRADALGLVAESALAGGLDPGSPGDRFQVTVHVEAETLCCRGAASAAADTSAETRMIDPAAPEPAAPAAHAAAGQAPIDSAVGPHLAAEPHGGGPATTAPGPDAGQAVIADFLTSAGIR